MNVYYVFSVNKPQFCCPFHGDAAAYTSGHTNFFQRLRVTPSSVKTYGNPSALGLGCLNPSCHITPAWNCSAKTGCNTLRSVIIQFKKFSTPSGSVRLRAYSLGIEKSHMVGLSLGGLHTMNFALRAPERVESAAILSPAETFLPFHHDFYQYALSLTEPDGVENRSLLSLAHVKRNSSYEARQAKDQPCATSLSPKRRTLREANQRNPPSYRINLQGCFCSYHLWYQLRSIIQFHYVVPQYRGLEQQIPNIRNWYHRW